MKKLTCALILACTASLAGCLFPESFVARLGFEKDGSYTFTYAGTAVNPMASYDLKGRGTLRSADEEKLAADATSLKSNKDVKAIKYKGAARYDLTLDARRKAGESMRLLDVFFVTTGTDGVTTVASIETKENDRKMLEDLGIKINGTLDVRLPANAEVISRNATSTPSLFSSTYGWKIGKIGDRPILKFRLK